MDSRPPLIFVTGTPSGGTSLVAGMLHRLGVDMGTFPESPGVRGYVTYEDTLTDSYKYDAKGVQGPPLLRQRLWLRKYVHARIKQGSRPFGVKGSALWWLDDPDPATLPIRVVRVVRPLEDAIRSDWKYQEKIHRERPDLQPAPPSPRLRIERASALAAAWSAAEDLFNAKGAATVHFYDVLATPRMAIRHLCLRLGLLDATDSQATAAAALVNPEMRHV